VVGGVNNGLGGGDDPARLRARRAAATAPIRYQAEIDRLIALAREHGRIDDPDPPRLAWAYGMVRDHALQRDALLTSSSRVTTRP
jgi:hypothetical protein